MTPEHTAGAAVAVLAAFEKQGIKDRADQCEILVTAVAVNLMLQGGGDAYIRNAVETFDNELRMKLQTADKLAAAIGLAQKRI